MTTIQAGQRPEFGVTAPRHRLPPEARPGLVRLQVADLERSLQFYQDVLGLELLEGGPRKLSLGATGGDGALVELTELPQARAVPRLGRLGLYHFAIRLSAREALGSFVVHLQRHGLAAGMSDHDVSEAVYIRDPDGLGIEIYVDRRANEWPVRGRELHMDTRPLDVADLVASSGDRSWSGAPADSTIGHIHLHVRDLELAKDFYHGALGFDLTAWSYSGALFLAVGGYHHHLGVNTWAGPDARRPAPDEAQLLSWELAVPAAADVDATARSLEAAGYPVVRDDGGVKVPDPWGTVLELVST